MAKTIKINIKPTSNFKSKLQSDTIFGMFAWGYRYLYGEEKLEEILKDFLKNPFIVFSDGFPENTLPRPILIPSEDFDLERLIVEILNVEKSKAYKIEKILKKVDRVYLKELKRFIEKNKVSEEDVIKTILNKPENSNPDKIKNLIKNLKGRKGYKIHKVLKNSVNRIENRTTGMLYLSTEYAFSCDKVEIYAKYNEDVIKKDEIEEVFKYIGETGFGADKSTGKGRFELLGIDEEFDIKDRLLPEKNRDKNGFVSLSCGLLLDGDIKLHAGKTFTKFGKAGGDWAITGNHFKNPVILFAPGSTFYIEEQREYYGNGTDKVFKGRLGYHSGYMLPLFINLPKEIN